MSRRVTLPGADELFRATGGPGRPNDSDAGAGEDGGVAAAVRLTSVRATTPVRNGARSRAAGTGRPTGREKHDEKITVYVSPEELLALEHARLDLRAVHGLAVDRGRIVREAMAVVLADLAAKGADSILVRRLLD